jgi:dihydrodipicolinate synthase/N-acetylneuraminate lyase
MTPSDTLPSPLRGIIPPLVTPLKDVDDIDQPGLEHLIAHVLDGGVHGLFVLGTTGEAPSLSHRLRRHMIKQTCDLVRGHVPILVGITDTSFAESIAMAQFAARCGAQAVVLAPPYYFEAGQQELLEYLQHLVDKLPLPLFLYNMPSTTKLSFEPATVLAAADIPGIVGLKDSSGNMTYFHQLQSVLQNRDTFTLLVGAEQLLAETVLLDGHGGVNGGANLYPQLYVQLYDAAVQGDLPRVKVLHEKVMHVSTTLYGVGHYSSSYLKGLKCALSIKGVCSDFMAEPFHRFRAPERRRISDILLDLDDLIEQS